MGQSSFDLVAHVVVPHWVRLGLVVPEEVAVPRLVEESVDVLVHRGEAEFVLAGFLGESSEFERLQDL